MGLGVMELKLIQCGGGRPLKNIYMCVGYRALQEVMLPRSPELKLYEWQSSRDVLEMYGCRAEATPSSVSQVL